MGLPRITVHENPDLLVPVAVLLLAVVCLSKLLLAIPRLARRAWATWRRLDSLDRPFVALDFHGVLAPSSSSSSSSSPALAAALSLASQAWARRQAGDRLEGADDARVSATFYRFRVRQSFQTFKSTGLAVWGDAVSLGAVMVRPSLLSADPKAFSSGILKVCSMMPGMDPKAFAKQRVIELGCGLGVTSMVLQRFLCPSTLLATDGDPEAVKAARANVKANGCGDGGVAVKRLCWGQRKDIRAALAYGDGDGGRFDLVYMSDVTYWPAPLDLLQETIVQLVKVETGMVIIAHKDRSKSNGHDFFDGLRKFFRESAHAKVRDVADSVGQTGGDITEEAGWFHVFVFRGLTEKKLD